MNSIGGYNATKIDTPETVSDLLEQFSIQAEGRGRDMDLNYKDKVCNVINKLETLSDLFEFYWYARHKTGFKEHSIDGLCLIIADCIDDLEDAVK